MPIRLDTTTILVADISVTAIVGSVLLFTWFQNRIIRSIGWWAAAHLLLAAAIAMIASAAGGQNFWLLQFGVALMLLAYGLMWNAARLFDRRSFRPLLLFAGPCFWLVAKFSGYVNTLDQGIIICSVLNAAYCLAAAFEFWRGRAETLISRWPAIFLLAVSGLGFLSWVPMTIASPFAQAGSINDSLWFPVVILVTLLGRLALAFVVLAMAKERLELQQRTQALTDPLTGLPNRRAFFRAAARKIRARYAQPQPMTVMVFDLDHFKEINDKFGHAVGDRVLQVFSETLTNRLQAGDIIGRLGGEEFAALLPSTDFLSAAIAAERVRSSFALSAVSVDGITIGATVSIGLSQGVSPGCNLHALIDRADFALYAAKNSGRNRVEIADNAEGWKAAHPMGGIPQLELIPVTAMQRIGRRQTRALEADEVVL